ncbi:MAG: trehalose-phosphatase [Chloroflexota bacterium]
MTAGGKHGTGAPGEKPVEITKERIRALIFDMDGVITDTARVHAAAWKRLFDDYLKDRAAREGGTFEPFDVESDYLRYVDGKPRYEGAKSFLESRGVSLPYGEPSDDPETETVCGLGNRKNAYFQAHLREQGVDSYSTSIQLLQTLRRQGFATAVISASTNATDVLESAGVADLFDVKVDGVDSQEIGLKGKPEADIFLEAARRLGVQPREAAVIEDALAGVEAGRKGQFGLVIGVDRSGQKQELLARGADVVVEDLGEISVAGASARSGHDDRTPGRARSIPQIPPATEHLQEIFGYFREAKPAIFLDYDGTLTPIVSRPEDALLPERTRQAVRELNHYCTVGIISGRDVDDVRSMVGINGLVYSGSHGFDIVDRDGSRLGEERWGGFLPHLDSAEAQLRESVADVAGAWVERKRYAIAVHYRNVQDHDVSKVEERVDRALSAHEALRKTLGKKIFELRPDIDWDKGRALLALLDALGLSQATPVYIGDDVTDEDAFRVLHGRGISIIVGVEGDSLADYRLRDPQEVHSFLLKVTGFLKEGGV